MEKSVVADKRFCPKWTEHHFFLANAVDENFDHYRVQ
jgi:hypothetical protein